MATILANLVVYGLVLGVIGTCVWLLTKNKWLTIIASLISMMLAYLAIASLSTLPPTYVSIDITTPQTGSEVRGPEIPVGGSITPAWARVFVLVHPIPTDRWYVQNSPDFRRIEDQDQAANWLTSAYLGTETLGQQDTYEIIALASSDFWFLDVLRGRELYTGENIGVLPIMNQSNVVTVKRVN